MNTGPGIMLVKTTPQNFTDGALSVIQWDQIEYERIGKWDAAEPSRIYVPSGVRYARASAGIAMDFFYDASPAVMQFRVRKNSSNVDYGCAGNISMFTSYVHTLGNVSTPWMLVNPRDWFDVAVVQGCGQDNTMRTTGFNWFAVEFWEES